MSKWLEIDEETDIHVLAAAKRHSYPVSPTFKPLSQTRNCFLSHLKTSLFFLFFSVMFQIPFRLDHFNLSQTKFLIQLSTWEYIITLRCGFARAIENCHTYLHHFCTNIEIYCSLLHYTSCIVDNHGTIWKSFGFISETCLWAGFAGFGI